MRRTPLLLLFALLFACGQKPASKPERFASIGKGAADYPSLQQALHEAPPEVEVFLLEDPVHTEAGIVVERDAEIRGIGAKRTILQAGDTPDAAADRVLTVAGGARVVVRDITIRHGQATEGLRGGGGIRNYGELQLIDCRIENNRAIFGAGVLNYGLLSISDSLILNNRTLPPSAAETVSAAGCTGAGGGIKNEPSGELYLSRTEIRGNYSRRRGGGLFIACESEALVEESLFTENECGRSGGGIHNRGDLELRRSRIVRNSARKGAGGIQNLGRTAIFDTRVKRNSHIDLENASGGGFYGQGELTADEGNRIGILSE